MKKFNPNITGGLSIDCIKYPFADVSSVKRSIAEFIKTQYPSKWQANDDKITFYNKLFRIKVSRSRNTIRAFNKGKLTVFKDQGKIEVTFSGSLYRGVAIAAIQALIVTAIVLYANSGAFYLAPLFFLLAYFLQVYLTHIVFPMALGKWLHQYLKDNVDENT
jgi:hypothetical protein